jgi:hypothetical protein
MDADVAKVITALEQSGESMWSERAISMLESLEGSGVSLDSETMVDDLLAAGYDNPKITRLLQSLPGYPSAPADAVKHLEFLVTTAQGAHRASLGHHDQN